MKVLYQKMEKVYESFQLLMLWPALGSEAEVFNSACKYSGIYYYEYTDK